MRVCLGLLFAVSIGAGAYSQGTPCGVVTNVVNLAPSSFLDAAAAQRALSFQRWRLDLKRGDPFPLDVVADEWGYVEPGWGGAVPEPIWTGVQGLATSDFAARDGHGSISIRSSEPDRGPHRIAFVVESGGRVSAAAREMEAAALTAIVSTARPEDSFGLVTAGEPHLALPFGSSRQALLEAAQGLVRFQPGGTGMKDLSDALVEASSWFGASRVGDSLFLVAQTLGSTFSRGTSRLRPLVRARQLRLFTLGLGPMIAPISDCPGCWGSPFASLSEESGGGWEQMGKLPRKGRATDANLRLAREQAEGLYAVANALYILQIERAGPDVVIYLSAPALEKMPWGYVIYATPLPVCPPPGSNTSGGGKTK